MEISTLQSCSVRAIDDMDRIWSHLVTYIARLYFNDKIDAEIFVTTHLEVKFGF